MDQDTILGTDRTQSASLVFYTVIFFICLVSGLWGGMQAGQRINPYITSPLPLVSPIPTPATGQSNVLIIGVDRLTYADPRLESIWLLAHFPGEPDIKLIPLYPKPVSDPVNNQHQIAAIFELSPAGFPGKDILDYLHQQQIWWSSYIILDEVALIEILDFVGGVKIDGQKLSGALALGSLTPAKEDQLAAVNSQMQLLQELCLQINNLPPQVNPDALLSLIPWHIKTDLNIDQTIADLHTFMSGEKPIQCEFPMENLSQ